MGLMSWYTTVLTEPFFKKCHEVFLVFTETAIEYSKDSNICIMTNKNWTHAVNLSEFREQFMKTDNHSFFLFYLLLSYSEKSTVY